jgi:hypothetical protein
MWSHGGIWNSGCIQNKHSEFHMTRAKQLRNTEHRFQHRRDIKKKNSLTQNMCNSGLNLDDRVLNYK